MTEVKANPGAPAVRLYYSYFRDDNSRFVSEYERIKILNQAGLKYANVEIVLNSGDSIKELKARTIHPDGSVVEFTGKPFEKTVNKGHGVKRLAKTFTLPDVTVGSIVEYSYVKIWYGRRVWLVSEWQLEGELYTIKERFRYRPFLGAVNIPSEWDRFNRTSQAMCSYSNKVGAPSPQKGKDGLMEIELDDVSTFEAEDYMPPQSDYKPTVMCYYGGREFASAEQFWPVWEERISKFNEQWLGKASGVREAAEQAVGGETDPEKKLRRLYARAQQVRNLSFERERTANEEKKEKLKPNENVHDVLEHGYGSQWEIDGLFVALARAEGFDASLIATSDRSTRSFSRMILWLGQFDGVAALVNLNGKDLILDPGTIFCPFGTLDWKHSAATAWSFKPGKFFTTPEGQSSVSYRTAKLQLADDGTATGEIILEFHGQEALVRRLDGLETDEAGKRKLLEDEVLTWFPSGSQAKVLNSQGWESTEDPLVAHIHVDSPLYASVAGKRLVAPVYFFPAPFKSVFDPPSRSYPMVFSFPFAEKDEITLQIPEGYSLESAPSSREAGLPNVASYQVSSSLLGNKLTTSRNLHFDHVSFGGGKYYVLQSFFKVVQAGDGTQVVLRAESANAGTK